MSFLTDDVFTSRTANGALNFATTRSHLLDFFFQAVPKARAGRTRAFGFGG